MPGFNGWYDAMPIASLLWLAIGALLNVFSGGRWAVAVAAWLAPVFLLHFSRSQPDLPGMLGLYLALFGSITCAYRGLIPAPAPASTGIAALIALASLPPFVVDTVLAPHIPGFASTLVFPLTWAVMDLAVARFSPYGTWGSLAHTQYGHLPLMQCASFTGAAGVTFLVAWFASVLNWAWNGHFDAPSIHAGLLAYGFVLGTVVGIGGLRLRLSRAPTHSVRVAAVGWPEGIVSQAELMRALDPSLSEENRRSSSACFDRVNEHLLAATEREARAGAQIAVWPEASALAFSDDETALLGRIQEAARRQSIHVLAGMAVVHRGSVRPLENKAVLVDPTGAVVLTYVKAIPVPGFESRLSRRGAARIQTVRSPHGVLAVAICFDMDFPHYIRQVGRAAADLLLVPASDWKEINRIHCVNAVFRAVENGTPMVRATRWGLSSAVDAYGRVLAELDPFVSPSQTMVAHVPVGHVATTYARLGDWFGGLCLVALAWLAVRSILM
jgi:apolipoprotein N-acyltransferase